MKVMTACLQGCNMHSPDHQHGQNIASLSFHSFPFFWYPIGNEGQQRFGRCVGSKLICYRVEVQSTANTIYTQTAMAKLQCACKGTICNSLAPLFPQPRGNCRRSQCSAYRAYLCRGVDPVASVAFTLAPACNRSCINGIRPLLTCSVGRRCHCELESRQHIQLSACNE